jgi:hypothetical protein
MSDDLITEDWLKSVGFKWHQFNRQPSKQWLLWCGIRSAGNWGVDTQDIGVEVCSGGMDGTWFCWLRSDTAHRYSRFLHVRHMRTKGEVSRLVEAVTGLPWKPENHIYGSVCTDQQAAHLNAEWDRLDKRMVREDRPWREIEKDDTRGGALPEHMEIVENLPMKERDEKA